MYYKTFARKSVSFFAAPAITPLLPQSTGFVISPKKAKFMPGGG
jgi:hypothetical protein